MSQPFISLWSVKDHLVTVPTALSAARAAQLQCLRTALLLCWYKDIQLSICTEHSAVIGHPHSPIRKLL